MNGLRYNNSESTSTTLSAVSIVLLNGVEHKRSFYPDKKTHILKYMLRFILNHRWFERKYKKIYFQET